MKINKSENIIELFTILGIATIALLFWDSYFIYPIKVFIVLLHEISHALSAILTGGKVVSIKFSLDLSGSTVTSGGSQIFIAASGYLGSLAIGSLLLLSSKYISLRKWFTPILSLIILLVAVNLIVGGIQTFICLIIAGVFFLVPKYFGETINRYLFKVIGITSCLYVIADIKQDLLTTTLRETDTQILEYLTGIPATLIGTIWFFVSISIVYFLVRKMISAK